VLRTTAAMRRASLSGLALVGGHVEEADAEQDACWMNANRGMPRNSAAFPLHPVPPLMLFSAD
jgi:hypothetical protein